MFWTLLHVLSQVLMSKTTHEVRQTQFKILYIYIYIYIYIVDAGDTQEIRDKRESFSLVSFLVSESAFLGVFGVWVM
jgi:hypothetical protein